MAAPATACGGTIDRPNDGGTNDALPNGCVVNGPDAHGGCGWSVEINDPAACGLDADASTQSASACEAVCSDPSSQYCYVYPSGTGQTSYSVSCGQGCVGRLPADVRRRMAAVTAGSRGAKRRVREKGRAVVGEHLARAAYLEAASVDAFCILHDELAAHGAPTHLRSAALRAARDEVRHAREAGALAKRYGARTRRPRVQRRPPRDLVTVALENAVEGCVRETFGALVAMWQAERATDAVVRRAMTRIARDEVRHAELGWRVAEWAERKLDGEARACVRAARDQAVRELPASASESLPQEIISTLGMPTPAQASALARALGASLWA